MEAMLLTLSCKLAATMLGSLMKQLTSSAIKEGAKIWNAEKELGELLATSEKIKAVLDKCDNSNNPQINGSALETWLQELEWYCYDIEDLVDDLSRRPKELGRFFISIKRTKTPHKIVELRRNMENTCGWIESVLAERQSNLAQQANDDDVSLLSDKTPLVSGTSRDGDKRWIIEKLKGNCSAGVSIVGIDGLGKSALARMILSDDSITSEFPLILCAHVAGEFQIRDVVEKLVASAQTRELVGSIQDLLLGKKVLIVLDDLWSVKVDDWESFVYNFLNPSSCWKILATTRNPNVAEATETFRYDLEKMRDGDCEHLIMEKAKLSESERKICAVDVEKIAEKCKGLPIVASKFGLTLSRKRSVDERIDTIRRFKNCISLMELPEFIQVLPRLMLNKPQLPPHLKRCFAYCSLFLPNHKFRKDELIQVWEIEGFVQPQDSKEAHLRGSQCFDDLLSRSILQPVKLKQPACYEIHDFTRAFAETFASKVFLRVDEGTKKTLSTCKTFRHLSLACQKADPPLLEDVRKCKRLRTFRLLHQSVPKQRNIPYSTFQKLERLRLLDLSHTNICELKPINSLKHLRYLNLSGTTIQRLPEPISPFFRALQVLKLENCRNLSKLPRDLNQLISLRDLDVNMQLLPGLPLNLGMLTNLEYLSSYAVGKVEGTKVAELRNMEQLREICISRLENVASGEEAQESMLRTKQRLRKLTLEWDGSVTTQMANIAADDVLQGLEPENDLKDLTVRNYRCQKFPAWLTSQSRKLVSLYLENCHDCKALPPLGQLPLLRSLVLHSFDNVEIVDRRIFGQGETGFPSLESLEFRDMRKLLYWIGLGVGDMPCLRDLKTIDCPRLVYLPPFNHQVRLINLEIKSCPKLKSLPELSPSCNGELGEVIVRDSPLVEERCQVGGADWPKIKGRTRTSPTSPAPENQKVLLEPCSSNNR